MKYFITFIFCLVMSTVFAQNMGINLINIKSSDSTFLKENRRIKVRTTDGQAIAGKFKVVSDSSISIKSKIILIDSIISIRKASTFSAIAGPISSSIGGVIIVGSFVAISSGGFAVLIAAFLMPVGLPLFIVPLTASKHPIKRWKYEIVNE